MANLTIAVDDALLRRARLRALEQGTSVNAVLRERLEAFADAGGGREARGRLVRLSERSRSGSGPGGRTWTRDGVHDR